MKLSPPEGIGLPDDRSTVTASLPSPPLMVIEVIGGVDRSNVRVLLPLLSDPPAGATAKI